MSHRKGLMGSMFLAALALAVTGVVAGDHGGCTKSAEECSAHMKTMYQTRGWMGVELDQNEDGSLRITSVVTNSPADKAVLKADDILVSLNGVTLSKDTTESVMMKDDDWKIGSTLTVGLKRGSEASTVRVTLEKIPDALLARMIETHTKEYHAIAKN